MDGKTYTPAPAAPRAGGVLLPWLAGPARIIAGHSWRGTAHLINSLRDWKSIHMTASTLRRRALSAGYRIWKVRPGRYSAEYGPIALIDLDTGGIVHRGLTEDDVADLLTNEG